jgi:hypothetical protein
MKNPEAAAKAIDPDFPTAAIDLIAKMIAKDP